MLSKIARIANALFNSGALTFGTFKLKSGKISPFYIDLSCLLSSPKDFQCIIDAVADEVESILATRKIDKLASIELKGALILPSVAAKLNLPCLVVRKEAKEYGVTGRIAGGEVRKGERILFIDDVVTDGESKLNGVKPLLQDGAEVDTILVVIDREQGGKQNLKNRDFNFMLLRNCQNWLKFLPSQGKSAKNRQGPYLTTSRHTGNPTPMI